MSVVITNMEMPKECHGCRWFYFQGTTCSNPRYYLDARCELSNKQQDWWSKSPNGGWIGEDIDPDKKSGYTYYHHAVEAGTRAKDCPLIEPPKEVQL